LLIIALEAREAREQSVFEAVIAMCRKKILCRARLASDNQKPSWQGLLNDLRLLLHSAPELAGTQTLLVAIESLVGVLDNCVHLMNTDGPASLTQEDVSGVVLAFSQLHQTQNLKDLLERLRSTVTTIHAGSCEALCLTAKKMLQYRTAATVLVRLAAAHRIVENARVVIVRPPADAFAKPNLDAQDILATTPQRALLRAGVKEPKLQFEKAMGNLGKQTTAADDMFREYLKLATKRPRIHAEVQLVWYVDQFPTARPPRILASSKDACYLCHMFVTVHGKFIMRGCHGRLYPGWRLPVMGSGMQNLRERFAAELENRIGARMQAILCEPISKTMHPRESPALSSMDNRSSVVTARTVNAANEAEAQMSSDSEATVRPDTPELEPRQRKHKQGSPSGSTTQAPPLFEPIDDGRDERHGLVEADTSHDNKADASSGNDQPWQTVRQGRGTFVPLSKDLHIIVEFSTALDQPRSTLRVRARAASDNEQQRQSQASHVVDVASLTPGRDVACPINCRFVYLKAGQQVFRVELD
jgi:hypothetical protein